MDINIVIDKMLQFYPWIYSQTGLKGWQLLTIALGALFFLVLLLNYLRKTRLKKIYVIQSSDRPDIIGINLSGSQSKHHLQQNYRKQPEVFVSDNEEEQKSWGQTTKEWRQLREKIRHLQHDIHRQVQSEQYLKEQITELKNSNENLRSEISKREQIEAELKQQINELAIISPPRNQKQTVISNITDEIELQSKDFQPVPTSQDIILEKNQKDNESRPETLLIGLEPEHPEQIVSNEEVKPDHAESLQFNQKTESLLSEQKSDLYIKSAENIGESATEIPNEDLNQSENTATENDHGIPLDIKELKAIADLAKRLQARSQQRQRE